MFSTTWATAARDTINVQGLTIRAGQHTVDNSFRFFNSQLRLGYERILPPIDSTMRYGFQVGLSLYSIRYRLGQTDLLNFVGRVQREHWVEWTPTFGFMIIGANYAVRYAASITKITSTTCDSADNCTPLGCLAICGDDVAPPRGGGVIAAPTRALDSYAGLVTTQRLTLSLKRR